MKKLNKKTLLITLSVVLVILLGGLLYIGNYFTEYAIGRKPADYDDSLSPTYEENVVEEQNKEIADKNAEEVLIDNGDISEINIKTYDGLNLWAREYNTGSNKWAVVVHGYTSDHKGVDDIAYEYYNRGYNVILPDLRAHNNSEGDYMGMGLNDSKDIKSFVEYITAKDEDASIVLHGVSMGGATVMMAGKETEDIDNVVAIVEDCGYTSAYQMMVEQLEYRFSLPEFPIMHSARFVSGIKGGYDIKDAAPIEAIKETTKPILFIHGDEDTYVLPYMQVELYEAYEGEKDILTIEGAEHGAARFIEPEEYYDKVFSFVEKYN